MIRAAVVATAFTGVAFLSGHAMAGDYCPYSAGAYYPAYSAAYHVHSAPHNIHRYHLHPYSHPRSAYGRFDYHHVAPHRHLIRSYSAYPLDRYHRHGGAGISFHVGIGF